MNVKACLLMNKSKSNAVKLGL